MIFRACVKCGKPSTGSYCAKHKPKAWATSERRQRMHMSGGAWSTVRRKVLARDMGYCYLCDQPGADEVDHLIETAAGGSNDPSNCASAHKSCHARKHRDPEWAQERVEMALEVLRNPVPRVGGNPLRGKPARPGVVADRARGTSTWGEV